MIKIYCIHTWDFQKLIKKRKENLVSKTISENFPNLQTQTSLSWSHLEPQVVVTKKRTSPKYMIVKVPKGNNKARILQVIKRKKKHSAVHTHKPNSVTADFSGDSKSQEGACARKDFKPERK